MVKTNNIEELLKAKGISTAKKKKAAKTDYEQNIKRLYNIEAESEPPLSLPLETEYKLDTKWLQTEHNLVDLEENNAPDTNRTQSEHKVDTKLNTNSPYSGSNIINTTTTDPEIVIPKELQDMGVSIKSLTAYLVNMTAQELQQSIDAFNYDLMNNLVKSSTPLNMLFGILKKGRPYLSSHFTEQLNRDVAEAIRRSEEVEQKHKALEEANFKARFYEWRLNNKEEADRLLGTSGLGSRSEKIA